jgi:two-component system, NarL family, sensor kinase
MKPTLLILCFILTAFISPGQEPWLNQRDSLLHRLSQEADDSNKAWTMRDLGVIYLNHDVPDSAVWYARSFGALSEKLHLWNGKAISLSMQAVILADENKLDEGLAMDLSAIGFAQKAGVTKALANIYNNTAVLYARKGDYTSALDFYFKALAAYEALNNTALVAMANGNIAEIYNQIKDYKSAYNYSLKGIFLAHQIGEPVRTSALINLADALINMGRYDTALVVLKEDWKICEAQNYRASEIPILINMNYTYVGLGQYDLIKPIADKLMQLAMSLHNLEGQSYAYIGLKYYYLAKKDFKRAEEATLEAIGIAQRSGSIVLLREAYKEAANVEMARGDQKRFGYYERLSDSLDDQILSDKVLKNTKDIEGKYALSKKQGQIDSLNEQRKIQQLGLKQRTMTIWGLTGLMLVVILTGILYYRNYRNKKRLLTARALLQEKRILDLEKEKQLLATQAVLQGQVEERTRLAKDLHDGLGSILSSAKLSFSQIKDNLVITAQDANAFDRSMNILDMSINELRRVAHNMMPEALMKFGLDTALKDFCDSVGQSGALQLTHQSYQIDETSIPPIKAAAIYRIVQELVNNVIRHAQATRALVQLIREGNMLNITVEDNGKGFDKNILASSDGMGYLNLQNRVAYLSGKMDIQTSPGNGTFVNIEIANILS